MVVGAVTEDEVVQGGESNGKVDKMSSRKHRYVCGEEEGPGSWKSSAGGTTGGEPFHREVIANHPKHHGDAKR